MKNYLGELCDGRVAFSLITASYTWLTRMLPSSAITRSNSGSQESRVMLRTLLMWTPKLLFRPNSARKKRITRFQTRISQVMRAVTSHGRHLQVQYWCIAHAERWNDRLKSSKSLALNVRHCTLARLATVNSDWCIKSYYTESHDDLVKKTPKTTKNAITFTRHCLFYTQSCDYRRLFQNYGK